MLPRTEPLKSRDRSAMLLCSIRNIESPRRTHSCGVRGRIVCRDEFFQGRRPGTGARANDRPEAAETRGRSRASGKPRNRDAGRGRGRRKPAARGDEPRRGPHHLLRPDAGGVPLGAEPDHHRDRAADHRPAFPRLREPVVGGHRLSFDLDRGRAALRQALRHLGHGGR